MACCWSRRGSKWKEGYVAVLGGAGLHLTRDVVDQLVVAGGVVPVVALVPAEHKIIIVSYRRVRDEVGREIEDQGRGEARWVKVWMAF